MSPHPTYAPLRHALAVPAALAAALPLAVAPGAVAESSGATAAAATQPPRLVAVRAAHHPGFDRVVFEFSGGLPGARAAYVRTLTGDASGLPVRVAGRAVLRVVMTGAEAHDGAGAATAPARVTYALPGLLTAVEAGDVEGIVTYGLGLARRTPFQVHRLRSPSRVVVDVGTGFAWSNRPVSFVDAHAFATGQGPVLAAVARPVRTDVPATALLDRIFAGVTPGEHARGLRLVRSGATDFRVLGIAGGVARVQLRGGCDSGGSTVTIADEITRTLRPLPSVRWIKVLDPAGRTEQPSGSSDSIPTCLEP
ncbi:MAG: hypothetical protein JWR42_2726 [Marmoricola sp.]|nr:hypothetical protein [Marmoricola sp.]